MPDLTSYRQDIVKASTDLATSGIMTRSLHGNVSLRVPNTDTFLLTAGASLGRVTAESIAHFDLAGNLLEGTVQPVGAEIIQMHAVVYRTRPEFAGVVHTHSPYATSFAVAGQAIPVAYEPLARFNMFDGVPVAAYGPRGSDQSVNNIRAVLQDFRAIHAVLLENHGVLTFGDSVEEAVRTNYTVEESAEIILNSYKLGGPKPIPPDMIRATRDRAATFAAEGARTA